jgi:nucleoside phosphorylase
MVVGPANHTVPIDPSGAEISIGIVTALAIECAAMRLLTDDLRRCTVAGDRNHYQVGRLPSVDPDRPHRVVVTVLPEDGTRNAAAVCSGLLRSFPTVRCVVMSGIAGGVPGPHRRYRDVRLGDVVVATKGQVDFDHVRSVEGDDQLRRAVDGLSRDLLRAERELEVKEHTGVRPWERWLGGTERPVPPLFGRPPDPDHRSSGGDRTPGRPRIHRGAIGRADRLIRDAARRDEIASRYDVRAVEMESSGVAVGSALHAIHWFVVRGIADYCDRDKDDSWHPYASLAAAAYVRALLAECYPLAPPETGVVSFDDLMAIIETLLDSEHVRDDTDRDAIMAHLPASIRTAVPDHVRGAVHLAMMVRACVGFSHGKQALLHALRMALPADSLDLLRAESAIEASWPR